MRKILEIIFNIIFGSIRTAQKFKGWFLNKYSSQVQAKINPYTSCAAHSGCWFLQNIDDDYFKNYTPDNYSKEINSKKYLKWTRENLKNGAWIAAKYKGNLNQVWDVQRKFIKDKLEESGNYLTVIFNQSTKIETIKKAVKKCPVIININPIHDNFKIGHIILVLYFEPKTSIFMIDDPFGDPVKEYKTGHINKGNDIWIEEKTLKKIMGSFSIYIN